MMNDEATRDKQSAQAPRPVAILFDLDGILVDTARFHYLACKEIADAERIHFDTHINERLKGVSRMRSVEIILERAPLSYGAAEKEVLAARKNRRYVEMLQQLTAADILPGISAFLDELRAAGLKTAVVSASRNAGFILDRLGLDRRFDTVVSGNDTSRSKPDPEGMLLAAARLGVAPAECVVIEDAAAGLEAAVAAGMRSIGIGDETILRLGDDVLLSTRHMTLEKVYAFY